MLISDRVNSMKRIMLIVATVVLPMQAMQLRESTVELPKLQRTLSDGRLVKLPDDIFKLTKGEAAGLSCKLETELAGDVHHAFSTAYGDHVAKIFYIALLRSRLHDLRISERWQESDIHGSADK